jgi:uncharacterized membrane protein YeaQ/YmgE (transglycosylase-associated protein family)
MEGHAFIIWGAVGLLAGWLASFVVGGGGLIRYLISGLIGSFVGGLILQWTGINIPIANSFLHEVAVATIGAIIFVFLARMVV